MAGTKWEGCRKAHGSVKYIIANGDEGDPGAYMDRSLMEGNPHSVVEGMIIGAFAIGSNEGYVYVRNEYPLACENIRKAIGEPVTDPVPAVLIHRVLREATIHNLAVPVLCGSALDGIGVQPVLDAVALYLPSPADVPDIEGVDPKKPEVKIVRKPDPDAPF